MKYQFQYCQGHVEVYDTEGKFLFSADNQEEAEKEMEEI